MQAFELGKVYTVVCETRGTRTGFKHEAHLLKNGTEIDKTKVIYYNRTWEKFTYQTVLRKIIEQNFEGAELEQYIKDTE